MLINISGGEDMSLHEVSEAAQVIQEAADPDANIIFGTVIDPRLAGSLKVTVIATGFMSDLPRRRAASLPAASSSPSAETGASPAASGTIDAGRPAAPAAPRGAERRPRLPRAPAGAGSFAPRTGTCSRSWTPATRDSSRTTRK